MKLSLIELSIYMNGQFINWYNNLPEEIKETNNKDILMAAYNFGCQVTSEYLNKALIH